MQKDNTSRRIHIQFANFTDLRQLRETPEADRLYVEDILSCPQSSVVASMSAGHDWNVNWNVR